MNLRKNGLVKIRLIKLTIFKMISILKKLILHMQSHLNFYKNFIVLNLYKLAIYNNKNMIFMRRIIQLRQILRYKYFRGFILIRLYLGLTTNKYMKWKNKVIKLAGII